MTEGAPSPAPHLSPDDDRGDTDLGLRAVRHWVQARSTAPMLVLACPEHPDPADSARRCLPPAEWETAVVVRMPACLGTLPRAAAPEVLLDGAAGVTYLLDGCAEPDSTATSLADVLPLLASPDARTGVPALRVVASVPEAFDGDEPTPSLHVLDARSMPVPRRALLGAEAPAPEPTPTEDDAASTDHARLVTALAALAADPARGVPDVGVATGRPGPGLLLRAHGCTACGVCVRVCGEGALTLRVEDGASFLEQRVDRCSGSGECLDACPVDALSTRRRARWAEHLREGVLPLAVVDTHPCGRCGAPTPTHDDLCTVCAFRRANPFGSHLPPGAEALVRRARGI
ncbi:4Fe-4S dicluster domain-containing protein [Mobilicoccus pelagius]|uniref:4Fe-4S ferredoxin-type domain-containing protein n=1 Tax=Mobilicoccus pelagius NBRC 104925 TaxID=1089455 RepID=H5UMY5_9MICO|nr:4Fe-4S dicluster domain-containing protein [Mobilicoccus pelagius]GAB47093.1 hypothetical protein MOPEL_003_01180 [Mobilicoccus pelagius NBRC 104925]